MATSKEVDLERTYDAPLDKVWRAWTEAEQVAKWWGPNGTNNKSCVWEARPGGKTHTVVLAGKDFGPAQGQEWESLGEFQSVTPREKLVFTNNPIINGQPVAEHLVTATFKEESGQTKVNIHLKITITEDTQEAKGALAGIPWGWNQQMDKLAKVVQTA
jgi:uncharacterized protein YndB with AHSA1/START domain